MTRNAKLIAGIIVFIFISTIGYAYSMKSPGAPNNTASSTPVIVATSTDSGTTGTAGTIGGTTGGTSTGGVMIHAYGNAAIKVGEQAKFPGVTIAATSVEDSRCATGNECLVAATATVGFTVTFPTGSVNESLSIGKSVTVSGVKILLSSVGPYPVAGHDLAQSDYIITFNVTKAIVSGGTCYVGGCSSELCTDSPGAVSSCIYRAEYACYRGATCERQSNGQCGFTQTAALTSCLANPPATN